MDSDTTTDEIRAVNKIDELEANLAQLPGVALPLVHTFTPGLYVRQIIIPAGTLLTSMEHKTEHPFIIVSGEIDVISNFETIKYVAPYMGITKPGTKRALYAHTETIWITIHANPQNITDPDQMVKDLTEENDNPLLKGNDMDNPNINIWRKDISPSIGIISGINQTEKLS